MGLRYLDLFLRDVYLFNNLRFLELSDLGRHAAATVKAPELPSISPEARCNEPTVTRVKFLGDTKQLEGVREQRYEETHQMTADGIKGPCSRPTLVDSGLYKWTPPMIGNHVYFIDSQNNI